MNRSNNFYISSSCLPYKKISDSVIALAESGIMNIELSGGTEFYEGIDNDLLKLEDRYGINFLIHNYFPPPKEEFIINLANKDESEKSKIFKHIKNAIALARALGIDMYSIHPGFTIDILPLTKGLPLSIRKGEVQDKDLAFDTFYRNLDYIIQNMLDGLFKVAIENKETFYKNKNCTLLCNASEVFEFLEYYRKNPNIGFLLDLGHLNISSSMQAFDKSKFIDNLFYKYKDKIFEIHLSENDAVSDTHEIIDEYSWQIDILKKYRDIIRGIPIVIEGRSLDLKDVIKQYKVVVNNFYG